MVKIVKGCWCRFVYILISLICNVRSPPASTSPFPIVFQLLYVLSSHFVPSRIWPPEFDWGGIRASILPWWYEIFKNPHTIHPSTSAHPCIGCLKCWTWILIQTNENNFFKISIIPSLWNCSVLSPTSYGYLLQQEYWSSQSRQAQTWCSLIVLLKSFFGCHYPATS